MANTIIAYDLGTGGIKASLYHRDGECLGDAFVAYDTSYPQASWHEQRPDDWYQGVVAATRKLLSAGRVDAGDIACLAISGHSLGCVPLDAKGRLLRASTPIWSDKRPTARQLDPFFAKIDPVGWYRTTGCGFPPAHYTVFKILWYRDHEPDMFRHIRTIVGTKDYVNFRLAGQIATDYSYASGCGLYDLLKWDYSDELLAAAGLGRELLPPIGPATKVLGELTAQAADELHLPRSVKVACGGVDNSCMAAGARAIASGRTYASLGSSAWIAAISDKPLLEDRAKPYVFTHVVPGLFTSATAIFSSGTSFKWVRDRFCQDLLARAAAEGKDVYELMTALAATSPVGANKLLFNPSLAGGSSLEASPHIRGAFAGIDLGHTQADVVRSAMEGIALNLRIVLDELRRLCPVASEMVVVGGSSRSELWRQIFADAFGIDIVKTTVGQEAGSLGAAAVAAVGAGLWKDFSPIDDIHKIQAVARPVPANRAVYDKLLPAFRALALSQASLGDELAGLRL